MAEATIGLAKAVVIAERTLAKGRELKLQPLSVAVLDAAGCLVAFQREDGSTLLRPDIAIAKAWGALAMGVGTRAIAARAAQQPSFIQSIATLAGGRIVPVPGGVLIRNAGGAIIGAVGVSGDTSDNDETCAVHAIGQAGYQADTGAPR
jgi:uncharacterized protein GlcG (DUF336 family)